jgi:hypothetical protein
MASTQLRTEVEIEAPASRVYRVLCDFRRYPEWNPFITSLVGDLRVGALLTVALSLPEGNDYRLRPTLTELCEASELRWRGPLLPALLYSEHFFQLSAQGEHRTRLVQGQTLSGVLLRFSGQRLTLTMRGMVYMNQALKKRAEQLP